MVARILLGAGWALGIVSFIVWGDVARITLIPAALLLIGAAACDVAGEIRFRGNRRVLNGLLLAVALLWLVVGCAIVL